MSQRFSELLRAIYPAGRGSPFAWDQALLRERAARYFRRNTLVEVCMICVNFLWPAAPWPAVGLLAFLSVICTWTACIAAIALLENGESLLGALLGRRDR